MPAIRGISPVPALKEAVSLTQAAAVQNTWYTVLNTTLNVEIHFVAIAMGTLAEDIELRVTIDGLVKTASQAGAVADTFYFASLSENGTILLGTTRLMFNYYESLGARSVKVEVRKTTANGANPIYGLVNYSQW